MKESRMRAAILILAGALLLPRALLCQSAPQLSTAVRAYVSVSAPVVALTHVRVIDGTGAPAAEDQTIVINNGKIASVGPAARISVPAGAQVMDGAGKTVIPGLFGMHDHTFYPSGGAGNARNHHPFSAPRL